MGGLEKSRETIGDTGTLLKEEQGEVEDDDKKEYGEVSFHQADDRKELELRRQGHV